MAAQLSTNDCEVGIRGQIGGINPYPLVTAINFAIGPVQNTVQSRQQIRNDTIVPRSSARHGEDFTAIEFVLRGRSLFIRKILLEAEPTFLRSSGHER